MAAPAAIPETVESPFRNGVTAKRLPTPEPATRERTASRTKKTSTRIWKVIRTALARCATLIPRTLSTVVSTMKRSEEHTSELQSRQYLVCRLLLEKKKKNRQLLG